jgi:hypothetical protein
MRNDDPNVTAATRPTSAVPDIDHDVALARSISAALLIVQ